ncbi:MAG: metallophosphoesterase [Christensenellaceae bacterium]|nr:metallophosphoesterase [Christensenellaceae bacterium]
MRKRRFLIVLAAFLAVSGLAFYDGLTIRRYEIKSSKIKGAIRIVQLSDLHGYPYGGDQAALLQAIAAQEPDLIALTGDIADDLRPIEGVEALLKGLKVLGTPCFYVSGNHEIWSGRAEEIKALFRSYGVRVLEGESERLLIRGQALRIAGVDDPSLGNQAFAQGLKAALFDPSEAFTLLLSHRPERLEEYGAFEWDLLLAGHAHGGQVRLPPFVNGLYAPNQGLFPEHAGGLYELSGRTMVVSRGLTRRLWSTRLPRIFNPPELVVIELLAG